MKIDGHRDDYSGAERAWEPFQPTYSYDACAGGRKAKEGAIADELNFHLTQPNPTDGYRRSAFSPAYVAV